MLGRLFKYDMKSTASILAPVSALAILVAMLATVSLKVVIKLNNNQMATALNISMITIFALSMLSLIAYLIICWIVQLYRFYKGLYTDEGYLIFTLPVKCWQILLSKLLSAVLWMIICCGVLLLCAFVIITFGSGNDAVNIEWISGISKIFNSLDSLKVNPFRAIVTGLLSFLISSVCGFSIFFLSITVGAIISKKHKILAAIGTYYGINLVLSVIQALLSTMAGTAAVTKSAAFEGAEEPAAILLSAVSEANIMGLIVNITVAVLAFFICNYLMKNKLNLA